MADQGTQPTVDEAAAAAAALAAVDTAGTAPGSTDAPAAIEPPELPFKLEDVEDEAQRNWLRARQAQMQAGYTKAIEAQREREQELQAQVDVLNAIEDEGTRREALKEFNAKYGVELEWDDTPDPVEPGTPATVLSADDPVVQRIAQLEAEAEERRANDVAQTAEQHRKTRLADIDAHLAKFAKEDGFGDKGQDVPEHHRDAIIEIALARPALENGLLNMDEALTIHRARIASLLSGDREKYLGSKDTPHIAIGGGAADPQYDLSKTEDRLKKANLIAQRHST